MGLFYSAYFIKTQESEAKLKEKFLRVDIIPESEWIICNFSNDYTDGLFEAEIYFTPEISTEFGEVIFMALDTSNDQLDYEHSKAGVILRKLCLLSDGCQSIWACVEGEKEEWERNLIFSEENLVRAIEMIKYDDHLEPLAEAQFMQKQQELRSLWDNQQYLLNERFPLVDATVGMAIQQFFNIKMPSDNH